MSLIPVKANGNLTQTTKLDAKDLQDFRSSIAKIQAEARANGFSIHFIEDGKLYERRPDGSRHEVTLPVSIDCDYDIAFKRPRKNPKSRS